MFRRGALVHVAAFAPAGNVNVIADGHADPAIGQFVSGDFFQTLGFSAERGRELAPADDAEGAEPVVVLSRQFWVRRFAMDPSIVGKPITINGMPFTVAGVMAESFRDIALRGLPAPPDVSIPLAFEPRLRGANSMLRNAGHGG